MMTEAVGKRRRMPIVLTLSLAANLAVVAAVSGAAWRHKGEERGGPPVARGGAIYMQALPREVRHDLHKQLRATMAERPSTEDMLVALRQEPFDPAAAARVLEAEREAGLLRQDKASGAWLSYITALSVSERNAYADRLQELSERRNQRKDRKAD